MPRPCCCKKPCNCDDPGAKPIADFTRQFVQVGSALTLSLTDTSTPGTCGEIASWLWKRDGTTVSTSQNPTGVTLSGAGPWTIELTVTDAAGCTDDVSMVITKPASSTCSTDTIFVPTAIELDWGSLSGNPDCDDCAALSGPKRYDWDSYIFPQHEYVRTYTTACGVDQIDRLRFAVCHELDPTNVIISVQQANNTMSSFHGSGLSYRNVFPRTTDFLNLNDVLDEELTSPAVARCSTAPSAIGIRAL